MHKSAAVRCRQGKGGAIKQRDHPETTHEATPSKANNALADMIQNPTSTKNTSAVVSLLLEDPGGAASALTNMHRKIPAV